jgi:hypothetical protein
MADNFKYEIYKCGLDEKSKVRYSSVVSSKKFRAEYEDIILQIAKTAVTAETLTKDICDRLFGEEEK